MMKEVEAFKANQADKDADLVEAEILGDAVMSAISQNEGESGERKRIPIAKLISKRWSMGSKKLHREEKLLCPPGEFSRLRLLQYKVIARSESPTPCRTFPR